MKPRLQEAPPHKQTLQTKICEQAENATKRKCKLPEHAQREREREREDTGKSKVQSPQTCEKLPAFAVRVSCTVVLPAACRTQGLSGPVHHLIPPPMAIHL